MEIGIPMVVRHGTYEAQTQQEQIRKRNWDMKKCEKYEMNM